MKKLADDREVSEGSYYYLLDWNDRDKKNYILREFNKSRLCDLNIYEYKILFSHVTNLDIISWKTDMREIKEKAVEKWSKYGFLEGLNKNVNEPKPEGFEHRCPECYQIIIKKID